MFLFLSNYVSMRGYSLFRYFDQDYLLQHIKYCNRRIQLPSLKTSDQETYKNVK